MVGTWIPVVGQIDFGQHLRMVDIGDRKYAHALASLQGNSHDNMPQSHCSTGGGGGQPTWWWWVNRQ